MTDLIMQAELAGCTIKSHLYALWDIQKWLRDEKEIYIDVLTRISFGKVVFIPEVLYNWCENETDVDDMFLGYEEALMDAIKVALDVLKNEPKPC